MQLQQSYAKQLSDDATVSSVGTSRNHSSAGPASGSAPGSRRGSSEGLYGAADSRGSGRPTSGTAGGTGRGIFESMSEKDQMAAAAARKKASQVEYYQQLQEADRRRSDPPKSSRVALNRRDQREDEGAIVRGNDGSRHSSRPSSDYSRDQRDQSEHNGYGSSQPRHTADGDLSSVRRRQQEDYARALREDAQAAPIADSYTAKRRSHHDIEDYGGRSAGGGAYTSERVQDSHYEREEKEFEPVRQGREQVREQERCQSREDDRYQERSSGRHQEREPERYRESDEDRSHQREQDRYQDRGVSGYDPSSGPPNPYGPSYGYEDQGGMGGSRRSSRGDMHPGRREETYGGDTSPGREYEPRRVEPYSPPSDRSRSRRESEEIKRQYLFGADTAGRGRQGGGGAVGGSLPLPDSSYPAG